MLTDTQKTFVALTKQYRELQVRLAETEQALVDSKQEAQDLRNQLVRDFDDSVILGHAKFLEEQRRTNLLMMAAQAIEASDAHVIHFDRCDECKNALLWCPEWYRICENAESRRKVVLSALLQERFVEDDARALVDTEVTELLCAYRGEPVPKSPSKKK